MGIQVDGVADVQDMLRGIAPKAAQNLNRSTIHAIAGLIRDGAKRNAPKGATGNLKKAIKAIRRRPRNPDKPFSDVVVEHGREAKHDAFYWRFLEYGTVHQNAQPFIAPAREEVAAQIKPIYRKEFAKKLEARLRRQAKKLRR